MECAAKKAKTAKIAASYLCTQNPVKMDINALEQQQILETYDGESELSEHSGLHCAAPHCSAVHSTVLQGTELHFNVPHCSALYLVQEAECSLLCKFTQQYSFQCCVKFERTRATSLNKLIFMSSF